MGGQRVPEAKHLLTARLTAIARSWRVTIDESCETEGSVIAYGSRGTDQVVLKLVKRQDGDEWRGGDVAAAFAGHAFVRVLEHTGGAVLMERARPGRGLFELSERGRDDDATAILADLVASMAPDAPPTWCATVADWGRGFHRYAATGDRQIPAELVARATEMHQALAATQGTTRLLHGDLQHYNVLEDRDRGWLAVDPKGVVGEIECEMVALLRNPARAPTVFADPKRIERRVATLSARLRLDAARIMQWAFALGVLSAIWNVEDGYAVGPDNAALRLVRAMEPMIC